MATTMAIVHAANIFVWIFCLSIEMKWKKITKSVNELWVMGKGRTRGVVWPERERETERKNNIYGNFDLKHSPKNEETRIDKATSTIVRFNFFLYISRSECAMAAVKETARFKANAIRIGRMVTLFHGFLSVCMSKITTTATEERQRRRRQQYHR